MEAVSATRPTRSAVPTGSAGPPAAAREPVVSPVMGWLAAGLPLTILLDLAWGVRSSELYAGEVSDLSWLRPPAVA